jgi:tetraacyldisaccharide 4'-kinase
MEQRVGDRVEGWWRRVVSGRCEYRWAALPILWLLSIPWAVVVWGSHQMYRLGLRKSRTAALPVVSIGNISVGGTGKTTTCVYLARELERRGVAVGIVLRGYGRKSKGVVLVSDGAALLASAAEAGDEALLLAKELPGCGVAVGKRREAAIALLAQRTGAQVVLLDDGFQYYRLARDIDLVLLDACTHQRSERLFPLGFLREPYFHLARATDVWITHGNVASGRQIERLTRLAERYAPGRVAVTSHVVTDLWDWDGGSASIEALRERPIIAVAGLGNPESFFTLVEEMAGKPIQRVAFRDHHEYDEGDWGIVAAAAEGLERPLVVTTPKDGVKMFAPSGELEVVVLQPALRVDSGVQAVDGLLDRVCRLAEVSASAGEEASV